MNMDLCRFFPGSILEMSRNVCGSIHATEAPDGGVNLYGEGEAARILRQLPGTNAQSSMTFMAIKSLGEFQKAGPVIIRPSMTLCNALVDTSLNFRVRDYHQPFPVIGIEIPKEILNGQSSSLAIIHQFSLTSIFCGFCDVNNYELWYHLGLGDIKGTIEEQVRAKWDGEESEVKMTDTIWRVCLNLGMLASTRQTRISPLSDKVKKNRKGGDGRLRNLAGRIFQEISFRDLVVYEKPARAKELSLSEKEQQPQHRRGHWKLVHYGVKSSLSKHMWINDYWTKGGTEDTKTIVMT